LEGKGAATWDGGGEIEKKKKNLLSVKWTRAKWGETGRNFEENRKKESVVVKKRATKKKKKKRELCHKDPRENCD